MDESASAALPPQHYYQQSGHVIAAGVVLSLLVLSSVALRFWARKSGQQPLQMDDWLLLPAAGMTIAVGICLVYGASERAFGYRSIPTSADDPSRKALEQMTTSIRLEWVISLILPFAMACTRASFVFFYKRIFSITGNGVGIFLKGLIVFLIVWALAFFFVTLFCCEVMAAEVWKPVTEMSQCLWFLQVLVAFCVTGFATDLVLIAIPIPLIWRLKLSTTNKAIASASFLLGGATAAAALARMIVSIQFLQYAADPAGDNVLNITLYVYWGMVEAAIGVFAACLPTLQVFFRRSAAGWSSIRSFGSKARSLLGSSGRRSHYPSDVSGHHDTEAGIRVHRSVGVFSDEKEKIRTESLGSSLSGRDSDWHTRACAEKGTRNETV